MSKLLLVAGARPNFMKIAPLVRAAPSFDGIDTVLVHTGQHFDRNMSDVFFEELGIPKPDHHLGAQSGSHAVQTARIMELFEPVLLDEAPDWVVVVGDVNSTLACALVAKKLQFPVAHVEAGLRSGDMTMPEEVNRRCVDAISDLLLASEPSGVENLAKEHVPERSVHLVGNLMVDTLLFQKKKLEESSNGSPLAQSLGVAGNDYAVVTLHRPATVDSEDVFTAVLEGLEAVARHVPIVFPAHPRTRQRMEALNWSAPAGVHIIEPLSYMAFLGLWSKAKLVLTDSGGLQEETSALGVPCLTLRDNTERPITVEMGTNRLVSRTPEAIVHAFEAAMAGEKQDTKIPLWDGHAAERVLPLMR